MRHRLSSAASGLALLSSVIGPPVDAGGQEADIVFERSSSVYVMSLDGRSETKLANNARLPACTPDGRQVIFVAAVYETTTRRSMRSGATVPAGAPSSRGRSGRSGSPSPYRPMDRA